MFNKTALTAFFVTSLLSVPDVARGAKLRTSSENRELKQVTSDECILQVKNYLWVDDSTGKDEEEFVCTMDAQDVDGAEGINLPIRLNNKQKNDLKKMLKNGRLVPGSTTLKHGNASHDNKKLYISNQLDMNKSLGKKKNNNNNKNKNGRHLDALGNKPILVVRVIDSAGKAVQQNAAQVGDDVFGTVSDPNNLKSQMRACSFNQLNVIEGPIADESKQAAPGVIEVTLPTTLEQGNVENTITTAVQAHLGFNLPGPYEQVMYVIQDCYDGCGYAAYAYINSWLSLYRLNYYAAVGVQMHEIGHNLGLAHSGGLNGATYTDHTGYMGNPCYGDDNCEICFNAAKNWQLPWYNDRKMLIDPRNGPQTVRMVGIADYENNSEGLPVVLKIETGSSTDQFIAFNRATGVNKDNDEADDEVTIVETGNNGEGYSQSYLKAHLIQGETYTYDNWAGTGSPLRVTATEIDLSANPAVATISIELVTGPTAAPTACSGKYIEVDITTDNYPSEISWTITNTCTGSAVLSGGPYSSANAAQDTESVCVEDGSAYDFAISDSYGDGICCSYGSGSYTVKYGGSVVASGGDYGSGETKSFGSCGGPGPTPSTASPTKSPTASPTKSPTASPTKSPTASPTKSPTKAPTQAPVASPTPPTGGCPTGQSLVEVDIKLDNYPGETTWSVTNCAGQSVRSGGPYSYSAANTDVSDSVCVPDGTGYKFKIDDSYGDGVCCGYGNGSFSVKYAGSQVASGGPFGSSFSTDFGDACPTGCPAGTKKFKLDLVTDYYPSETSWNLKTCNGQTQLSGTRYGIEQCIPDTSYTFTINDSWGDGICCSYGVGSYTVEYDNAVLKEGGDFGFSEQVLINGGCANIGVPNPVNVCSAYKKKGLCKRADEACVWKGNANNGRCVKGVKETPKKI